MVISMSRDIWSSAQYQRYADHRARPFFDLLSAVRVSDPGLVVDLGCGPGNLTAALTARWPGATVVGVDSSRDMLAAAAAHADPPRLTFVEADLREWPPEFAVARRPATPVSHGRAAKTPRMTPVPCETGVGEDGGGAD